jgi:hypothetical protein
MIENKDDDKGKSFFHFKQAGIEKGNILTFSAFLNKNMLIFRVRMKKSCTFDKNIFHNETKIYYHRCGCDAGSGLCRASEGSGKTWIQAYRHSQ